MFLLFRNFACGTTNLRNDRPMNEEKKKRKKKRTDSADSGHKVPWQEKYASVDDIKAFLDGRVMLRYNEVRGRTEVHWLSQGLVIRWSARATRRVGLAT